ncbi:MAG: glycosyltransferase family 4 protein [Ignavibacteriae bacterium]|nr:glycosyltransferase family 4 protein [Ignavibacteriota bacterium]
MKTILLISQSSSLSGGGEEDFLKLLKQLQKKFRIISIFPEGERVSEYAKYSDISLTVKGMVFPFSAFRLKSYVGFFIRNFRKIYKIYYFLKKNGPVDLCFANSSVCFPDLVPVVLLKIPYIVSVKEKINPVLIRKLIFIFYKKTSIKILTISNYLRNIISKENNLKSIEVIYSALDEKDYIKYSDKLNLSKIRDGNFSILNIGSIYPLKGQKVLIDALYRISSDSVTVDFIGQVVNHRYYEELKNLVKIYSLDRRVTFLGEMMRNDVIRKIDEADCIVITSKEEGQSMVVLESLLMEKPLITTKVGISLEIIKDGENGLTYNYGNPEELSNTIVKLKNDKDLYNRIAKNSKKTYLDNFNNEKSLYKYEEIIRNCLDSISKNNEV